MDSHITFLKDLRNLLELATSYLCLMSACYHVSVKFQHLVLRECALKETLQVVNCSVTNGVISVKQNGSFRFSLEKCYCKLNVRVHKGKIDLHGCEINECR